MNAAVDTLSRSLQLELFVVICNVDMCSYESARDMGGRLRFIGRAATVAFAFSITSKQTSEYMWCRYRTECRYSNHAIYK